MTLFVCEKPDCGFTTSGIINDSVSNRRWCPRCGSPLVQCNHCNQYVSATIRGDSVVCDYCGHIVVPEYATLNMSWHHSSSTTERPDGIGVAPLEIKCQVLLDGIPYNL